MDQGKNLCSVCEAVLPELDGMIYCPYCGMPVAESDEAEGAGVLPEDVTSRAAGQDEAVVENRKPLKEGQMAAREKYKALLLAEAGVKMTLPEDIYTLVLKGCDNKEVLIECLSQILNRGETAIRLAVGGMPAVLLYKVSRDVIEQVAAVLRDVDAVYAVVEGEFDYGSLYKSPDFARLSEGGRAALKQQPKVLWLGENIKFASERVRLDTQDGYTVLTDNALFFFAGGRAVAMLAAYQMEDMDFWEQEEEFFAEWVGRDGRNYRLRFDNQLEYDKVKAAYTV